ncbi:MarR family winged helix-turn-helix transcriptional regulator [Roseateles sp. LYH14W]|uniref:MarR family winged helix-turn-helix transcriptional regulator n=1 Tax=Pelomonas parva TaxID=3299032 RepID=A0ABW7EXJ5_9BURK
MAEIKKNKVAAPTSPSTEGVALDDPTAQVLSHFRLIFNSVKTHFQKVERKAGISGAQAWALSIISTSEGLGVSALARAMHIHQSTASNLVKALIERELIVAAKDGPDKRTVQLHLLPAGRKVLKRVPGPFSGVLPQALANLDPPTLQRLDTDLAQLIVVLGADERGAQIPLGE